MFMWFGLRKRIGKLYAYVRHVTGDLERRISELERLKGTLSDMVASAENATDKLNRVVERRRKQIAAYPEDEDEDELEAEDDDELEMPENDWPEETEEAFQTALRSRAKSPLPEPEDNHA